MFSQIAGFCWGGGTGTVTQPTYPLTLLLGERKILSSTVWDFPVLLSGHGKLWPGLCASVRAHVRLWAKPRKGGDADTHHPPPLPQHPGTGEPLAVIPFFSVMMLRKGCSVAPSLACLVPLLSIFPCYSSPNKGDGLALPSWWGYPHTRAAWSNPASYSHPQPLLCKNKPGEVIPWLIAALWKL